MAETLKARYGPEVPRRIAAMVERVHPAFDAHRFVAQALDGYDGLELMGRARRIALALDAHLPADFGAALRVVLRSAREPVPAAPDDALASFVYLPHTLWLAARGLGHLDASAAAMRELTQRFSCEFAVRPFLDRHPQAMLAVLARWVDDPSPQVRRLVSEGTRPRLPWAPRLQAFGRDPAPVLALLERLRDDPDEAVRRSVANHLNDLGRADPDRLVALCARWAQGAPPARLRLVRHALRTLVKRGDPRALAVLGYPGRARVRLQDVTIAPARPRIGARVTISFVLASTARAPQRILVDLRVSYAGRGGAERPKVFKLATAELAAGGRLALRKGLSLRQMSTRTHHPGRHRVEALVNGQAVEVGAFDLLPARP